LDSVTEGLIQESLDELIKGKTSIVIAHRLSTIKNVDQIIVMDKGMVVEQGTIESLIENKGKFYTFWKEQRFI
jgi:ABC-type multidrug transport system fused ATPase/permease subunit